MNCLIETERLILRPIKEEDAQDFFELDSNPNVHKYLGNNPVKSIEVSIKVIQNILEQYKRNGIGRLAVIKKSTQEFIGWSGLKLEEQLRKEFKYYDLGYRFKEQYWGNGYATEAAIASLDYGFNDLNLEEICAATDENNLASNRILTKIGMVPDGTFVYEGKPCNWYRIKNPNI